jgi:hypothetical protein
MKLPPKARGQMTDAQTKARPQRSDERIQGRCAEDTVECGDPVQYGSAVVKDVSVYIVHVVQRRERDAPAGAHKVQLRSAGLAVVEGDHDDARNERKRRMDEELFRYREQLRLDAMRRRAEREERFGKQENEFLPMVHRCTVAASDESANQGLHCHTKR